MKHNQKGFTLVIVLLVALVLVALGSTAYFVYSRQDSKNNPEQKTKSVENDKTYDNGTVTFKYPSQYSAASEEGSSEVRLTTAGGELIRVRYSKPTASALASLEQRLTSVSEGQSNEGTVKKDTIGGQTVVKSTTGGDQTISSVEFVKQGYYFLIIHGKDESSVSSFDTLDALVSSIVVK
jgi:hypothetical protein